MGLPERKQDEHKEEAPQKAALLDINDLFTRKPLPFKEVDYTGPDGTEGKVLVQALSKRELDEINAVQNEPVRDGHGNVIQESDQIGWDAKVVARALRRPNKTRVAAEHWQAKAEEIADSWLPGVVQNIRSVVLELSGFGIKARAEQKKD